MHTHAQVRRQVRVEQAAAIKELLKEELLKLRKELLLAD